MEVSHVQYADDTLFIIEGKRENAAALKWLLKNFEALSGLFVNFEKYSIFGTNIERDRLEDMARVLGCRIGEGPIPYLGLSVGGRVLGVDGWLGVVEKVRKKVKGWDVNSISIGGRATLVQTNLSSIPLYWMSFLLLPKSIEMALRSICCSFLWGGKDMENKVAWVRWEEMCKSKKEGGLGFRNLL